MSESLDPKEQALFDAACTDRLDDAARDELQGLLRQSPAVRRRYLDYAAMHADLFGAVRVSRVRERLVAAIDGAESISGTTRVIPKRRAARSLVRWSVAAAFTIAAALLIGFFTLPSNQLDSTSGDEHWVADEDGVGPWPGMVGAIRRIENVEWGNNSRVFAPEDLLAAGEAVNLLSGLVELEFRQGAVVVLEGPANLIANDANGVTLLSGKLAAVAPPWAKGFRVDTPGIDVVDHGTEFAVSVSGDSEAPAVNVVVTEGEVEVLAASQVSGGRRLKAGEGIRSSGSLVEDGDDAEARQLTKELPDSKDLKNAAVVGNRWTDWQPGAEGKPRRDGAWRNYTNSDQPFGFPDEYEELVWHSQTKSYRHKQHDDESKINFFIRAHRDGGHPGKGSKQVANGIDRYSISAFTVPADGVYRVEAGWLERRWARRWDRDQVLDIAIHVNDGPILFQEYCDRDCFVAFRSALGKLSAGDTVYVGVGPNGTNHNDRFRWGYYVVRENDPPDPEGDPVQVN